MNPTSWDLEADVVLALPIDDLALRVLKDRDSNEWNWQSWLQKGDVKRRYAQRRDVLNALSEAWAWLIAH